MEKALLCILDREETLVLELEAYEDAIKILCRDFDKVDRFFEQADELATRRAKAEAELREVRNEIRQYFRELFVGGG